MLKRILPNSACCNPRLEGILCIFFCSSIQLAFPSYSVTLNSRYLEHDPKQTANENSVNAPRTFSRYSLDEMMAVMHLKIHFFLDRDMSNFYKDMINVMVKVKSFSDKCFFFPCF